MTQSLGPQPSANQLPPWVRPSNVSNPNLGKLLHFAGASYRSHIGWFLRHRDTGVKNLATVLASEFAIVSLHYSAHGGPIFFEVLALVLLSGIAVPLGLSSMRSCRRSYEVSLRDAALATQVAWALGLTTQVDVAVRQLDPNKCPVRNEISLYPPKHLNSVSDESTVEEYVAAHIADHTNTHWHAQIVLRVFSGAAIAFGAVAIIAILI